MNVNWFKNPDNIVYAKEKDFVRNFAKETGIVDLGAQIEHFRKNPAPEGLNLQGKRRTTLKLMIPDRVFQEHLEMGENVWVYLGENTSCYCLYEDQEQTKA